MSDHKHEFEKFNIAFLGIRWQCIDPECNLIAPACFTPTFEAKSKAAQVDEILDEHLRPDPWHRETAEPGSAAYHGEPIYNRESYFR